MTENQNMKSVGFMSTKFGKVFLTIVAVFLTFAGPTYFVYGLYVVLKVDLAASLVTGLVLFIIGLLMLRYLVQKKVIS